MAGYIRWLDAIVMRIMDGLMAIPGILLAIALVSVSGASLFTVIFAITVPEIPRVVRLVRAVVLSVREEPYVEAAISVGTQAAADPDPPHPAELHSAADRAGDLCLRVGDAHRGVLSFLGAGTPPIIPSWGNMVAEARLLFQIAPWNLLYPGIALAITILCVNVLGDGLRDRLDPKLARRM